MKTKIIHYLVIVGFIWACSSDSPNDDNIPDAQGFTIEISGDINKTISGTTAFFSTSVSKDSFDRDLYTLVVSINDTNGDQVNIGITQLESIGSGNYSIAFEIEPPYNGFVNYSENPNDGEPIFGPTGGNITLNTVSSNKVTGSINVQCQIPGQSTTVTVKGAFNALSGS